jgi:hypothetical protein
LANYPDQQDVEALEQLTSRLERTRWIAAAVTIPLAWLAWGGIALFLNMLGMVQVAAILVATNLAVHAHRRRKLSDDVDPKVRAIRLDVALKLQIAADAVALSLAFWCCGGIESPLAFIGVFQVAAVASMLGRRAAVTTAGAMVTGIGIVMMLEFNSAIYHYHLMSDWRWGVQKELTYVAIYGGTLLAAYTLAMLIPARRPSS